MRLKIGRRDWVGLFYVCSHTTHTRTLTHINSTPVLNLHPDGSVQTTIELQRAELWSAVLFDWVPREVIQRRKEKDIGGGGLLREGPPRQ